MRSGHGDQGFNLSSRMRVIIDAGSLLKGRDRLSKAGLPNTSGLEHAEAEICYFGVGPHTKRQLVSHHVIRLEIAR